LLQKHDLITSNPSCRYLAAHCLIRQNKFPEALALLGEHSPTHLFHNNAKRKSSRTASRNTRAGSRAPELSEEESLNRRYEAGMCYLRGLCYAKQNAFDRAKEAYKDALRIDVQCYEAFTQLVRNSLMSPDEEDEFMQSLDFSSVRLPKGYDDPEMRAEPGEYVHMLYQTQLSKYRDPHTLNGYIETLSTHYGLKDNADILLARASLLYTQCRFKEACALTAAILKEDKYNFPAYPVHLSCLYELQMTNELFLIAHDLADTHPDEPTTWLAVGIYYLATGKITDARRYFSKASMMDATFGPAWIGFAHTFAAEGEHDQAVTAYSTAARLFTGTHLPQLFLGMQNHALNNMAAAEEYLKTAYDLCRTDPLLLNELGVVMYHQDRLEEAVQFFEEAIDVANATDADPTAWLGARTNLGHAYRRLRMLDKALEKFDEVLRDGGKDCAVFSAKALILLEKGLPDEAAKVLHEALAINPQDPVATELLNKALEESAQAGLVGLMKELRTESRPADSFGSGGRLDEGEDAEEEMERFELELDGRKAAARERFEKRFGGSRGGGSSGEGSSSSSSGGAVRDKGKGVLRGAAASSSQSKKGLGAGSRGRGRLPPEDRRESMMDMSDDD